MFSGWRCLEMQVAQYRRKKALYPPILLHHFVMEIVVLRPGQLIYLADGFCQPTFRYAAEYGLPQFSIVSLLS